MIIRTFAIANVSFKVILPLEIATCELLRGGVVQVIVFASRLTAVTFAIELLVS